MESVVNMDKKGIRAIDPQLFSLWVAMASIIMLFGAFTSAYIVKQAAGNWLEFVIPYQFYISTVVILLSSISLNFGYSAFIQGKINTYKIMLWTTLSLGIIFIALQYVGWNSLFNQGVDFRLNVSGSFFYLITGAHAAHVLGGIGALFVALIHAYTLKNTSKEKRIKRFRLTCHYWHFVDILWIYLMIFLLVIK